MARTYLPSHVPRLVDLWKTDLARVNTRAAESLADPISYPNLFPDVEWALKAEELTRCVARVPPALAGKRSYGGC
jgi:coatomer subunit beta'